MSAPVPILKLTLSYLEVRHEIRMPLTARFDIVNAKFDIVNAEFDIVNEKFDLVNEKFDIVNVESDIICFRYRPNFDPRTVATMMTIHVHMRERAPQLKFSIARVVSTIALGPGPRAKLV